MPESPAARTASPAAERTEPGLARSAASAGAATMTSRVLGLVRDQVLAGLFGAGPAMDAYNVAFRIPNLLRDLFAEGAMSAAFVPTFTRHLATAGRPSAWRLGNNVINALIVITGLLVALGIVFAESLVRLLAAEDYTNVPGQLDLTTLLARIMLPTLTFIALAAALMGMLNSMRHFFIPAFSPAMFNVVTIVCAFTVVPFMPLVGLDPIVGIAIGTLVGGLAQLALQWPTLRHEGFRYQPLLDWSDPGLRRVLVLMGPGTIGLAATQVNVLVNTALATGEGTGAVSWLNYAFRLMYLPIGLFGVSIATATLPAVSRLVAAGSDPDRVDPNSGSTTPADLANTALGNAALRNAAVRDTVSRGLSLMLTLNVPATVGLMTLATPIVRVIFERGQFTPADTAATAAALQFYAVGLLGYSVVRIASPTFYALGRNRVPVVTSVATVLVNAVLNVALVRVMGFRGLALGTSIAALFNAGVLFVLLRRQLPGLNDGPLASSLARITLASTLMGAAAMTADMALAGWWPSSGTLPQVLRLTATIGIGLSVLAGAAWLLRIDEFKDGVALVVRRFRRARA